MPEAPIEVEVESKAKEAEETEELENKIINTAELEEIWGPSSVGGSCHFVLQCKILQNQFLVGIILVPCIKATIELHYFTIFCNVWRKSKMSPWWRPNEGERLHRLLSYLNFRLHKSFFIHP